MPLWHTQGFTSYAPAPLIMQLSFKDLLSSLSGRPKSTPPITVVFNRARVELVTSCVRRFERNIWRLLESEALGKHETISGYAGRSSTSASYPHLSQFNNEVVYNLRRLTNPVNYGSSKTCVPYWCCLVRLIVYSLLLFFPWHSGFVKRNF
jgi:hypothetical protein